MNPAEAGTNIIQQALPSPISPMSPYASWASSGDEDPLEQFVDALGAGTICTSTPIGNAPPAGAGTPARLSPVMSPQPSAVGVGGTIPSIAIPPACVTEKTMSTAVTLLNRTSSRTQVRSSLGEDLLRRLDDLYAYYHKQWWCRKQMFYYYKWCHGFLNALALMVMAAAMVIGSISEDHFLVVGLTAFGTMVKGWNDFKNFSFKVDMC